MIRSVLRHLKWNLMAFILRIRLRIKFSRNFFSSKSMWFFDEIDRISMGNDISVGAFTVIHVEDCPISKNKLSKLKIGDRTYIGEFNNIRATGGEIIIGNDCMISQHVTIVASNHGISKNEIMNLQAWETDRRGVVIGNDVWIGANSVILPGVTIGDGVVIGAGSVVTKDIDTNTINVGSPCRTLKYRI